MDRTEFNTAIKAQKAGGAKDHKVALRTVVGTIDGFNQVEAVSPDFMALAMTFLTDAAWDAFRQEVLVKEKKTRTIIKQAKDDAPFKRAPLVAVDVATGETMFVPDAYAITAAMAYRQSAQEVFAYGDGMLVTTWGEATIAQHQARIDYRQRDVIAASNDQEGHRQAIRDILDAGVTCINEYIEKVARGAASEDAA